jgi:hypothetical protein
LLSSFLAKTQEQPEIYSGFLFSYNWKERKDETLVFNISLTAFGRFHLDRLRQRNGYNRSTYSSTYSSTYKSTYRGAN